MSSASSSSDRRSSNGSECSRGSASMPSPHLQHPYLSYGQATTIASWTSSIPSRSPELQPLADEDAAKREAAIEAYRQLKLAMFSKSTGSSSPKPLSNS
ncbi:hypothetical protein BU23DRAFT_562057 [Bimuria novae-zelandiae CBS 107.79]|uniref:Uncharacterized protein n=1 Tax=Bimuria novae-zelandiae CBS 107.79 TaxID=1447943 RepID=A0A6A5UH93_9PLEO|nr:hypothetical protein BU23DRAFT_562057 [Bimuria novae-zelandiae CBS 107.79]